VTYGRLAGTVLSSFRASSTALATPSFRATAFTRLRSTPLSLVQGREILTLPLAGGGGLRRHCDFRWASSQRPPEAPAARRAVWRQHGACLERRQFPFERRDARRSLEANRRTSATESALLISRLSA